MIFYLRERLQSELWKINGIENYILYSCIIQYSENKNVFNRCIIWRNERYSLGWG